MMNRRKASTDSPNCNKIWHYVGCHTAFFQVIETSPVHHENRTGGASALLQNTLQSLKQQIEENDVLHSSIDASINCFYLVQHAQTELRALSTSTLRKVLLMLENLKVKLALLSSGIVSIEEKGVQHERTKLLAQATLHSVRNIKTHELWCDEGVLHPGLILF